MLRGGILQMVLMLDFVRRRGLGLYNESLNESLSYSSMALLLYKFMSFFKLF